MGLDGEIKASRGFRHKRKSVATLDGVSSRLLTTMAIVRATAEDDRDYISYIEPFATDRLKVWPSRQPVEPEALSQALCEEFGFPSVPMHVSEVLLRRATKREEIIEVDHRLYPNASKLDRVHRTGGTPDGQYTNADTGLIYRARAYDPKTAQFLTTDPLNTQTHAPYTYTGDNPLNAADPAGRCGTSSVEAVLESVNPVSEENCIYQGTKAIVEAIGADASTISQATGVAAALLAPFAPPLAVALGAVSAATGAYAAGQEAGQGDTVGAAINALGGMLGGRCRRGASYRRPRCLVGRGRRSWCSSE